MRPDIGPGAVSREYELSDHHRGMRRTLSELQRGDPLVLVLSRGGFCQRTGDSTKASCNSTAKYRSVTAAS
jgi:hypothetical protein